MHLEFFKDSYFNMLHIFPFPQIKDKDKIATYDLESFSGGGFRYDHVLEYRVWVTYKDGKLGCHAYTHPSFININDFHWKKIIDIEICALIEQITYYDEDGVTLITPEKPRITEWALYFLTLDHKPKANQ